MSIAEPSARIAVVYYSATGNVHAIAEALAKGAAGAGADVRLRRAAETAPGRVVDRDPEWRAHLDATAGVPEATLDDLVWADGYAFGTPTRYGNMAAQLKQFIDRTGGIWQAGHLAGKPFTGFTSTAEVHGGQADRLRRLRPHPRRGRQPVRSEHGGIARRAARGGARRGDPPGRSPAGAPLLAAAAGGSATNTGAALGAYVGGSRSTPRSASPAHRWPVR